MSFLNFCMGRKDRLGFFEVLRFHRWMSALFHSYAKTMRWFWGSGVSSTGE